MSEVKGTLLTIVLVLAVFATVFTVITLAFTRKADDIASKIENAGNEDDSGNVAPAAPAASNALIYHY